MPRGRPLAPLEIGIEERETLERLVARRKTAASAGPTRPVDTWLRRR